MWRFSNSQYPVIHALYSDRYSFVILLYAVKCNTYADFISIEFYPQ